MEMSTLCFGPCECLLIELEDMCHKLDFFRPEEVVAVEVQGIEAFLYEAHSRSE